MERSVKRSNSEPVIAISGGFDPIHPGHLDLIKKASEYGLVEIILNSDDWLIRKKGFFFQSFEQRKAILLANRYVTGVLDVDDSDGTVCKALSYLRRIGPETKLYFGNGGDRKPDNTPEVELCNRLGIELVWNLDDPATKDFHSSFFLSKKRVERQWGYYDVLLDEPHVKIKKLCIYPGKSLSKQYHLKRTELFFYKDGTYKVNEPEWIHQPKNDGVENLEIIEVQTGVCEEEDIVRISD